MKNNNTLIMVVIGAVILLIAGFFIISKPQQINQSITTDQTTQDNNQPTVADTEVIEVTPTEDSQPTGIMSESKTFTIDASNFKFSIKEIKVKKGDKVKIVLNNKDGIHDWMIEEFDARTKQIAAGETDTVEFVADKTGTFEYYCSVGQHRQMGMVGNLIVE